MTHAPDLRVVAVLAPGVEDGAFAVVPVTLARGLRAAGAGRVYLVHVHGRRRFDAFDDDGITVVDAGARRSSLSAVALARVLRRLTPDLSISMPATVNIAAVVGWHLAGRPGRLIVTEHAIMSHEAWEEHRASLPMRLLPALARLAYPRASGLACVSDGVLADLRDTIEVDLGGLPASTIPNPVDVARIQRLSREDTPHPWLQDRATAVGLVVGRLAPQKNLDLALGAVRRVAGRMPFRLIVLGDGPERGRIQSLVEREGLGGIVDLPGHVGNPYAYMSRADVLVSSSKEEGFCLPIVEALACGLPVVATNCAGPTEILAAGGGLVVARNDAAGLAAAVGRVLGDPELAGALRRAGPAVAASYVPERIARRWLDFAEIVPVRGRSRSNRVDNSDVSIESPTLG